MFFSKILLGTRYIQSGYNLFIRFLRAKRSPKNENVFDQVLTFFYSNKYEDSEKAGMRAIEELRKSLLKSKTEINRSEFGEGSNILSKSITKEKVGDICRIMSKSDRECLFLFTILRALKPEKAIELGTCLGISAAYLGLALIQNSKGDLTSFEGSPGRAALALQNIKELGLEKIVRVVQGKFEDTLPHYLQYNEFLDFAFIDGHHQEEATLHYFHTILPKFANKGIMVFDDIFWSAGMNRAWQTIKKHPNITDSFVYKGMGVIQVKDVSKKQL